MSETLKLLFEIDNGLNESDTDYLTRQLLNELRDINLESVNLVSTQNSHNKGAKSIDTIFIGALSIAVLPAMLPELIGFLRDWSNRTKNHTIKIKKQKGDNILELEYDMKNISEDDIKKILNVLNKNIDKS